MEEAVKLSKTEQKQVEKLVEKLLSLLEIAGEFEVATKDEFIEIIIETKDTGMVIGYHGEVLDSLQLIFSLIISKKLGRFVRVSIEVDGYKKNRTEYLEKLAEQTKEKALIDNKEQELISLKPWERRIIHLYLSDDDKVVSESSGEGKERVLIVRPK